MPGARRNFSCTKRVFRRSLQHLGGATYTDTIRKLEFSWLASDFTGAQTETHMQICKATHHCLREELDPVPLRRYAVMSVHVLAPPYWTLHVTYTMRLIGLL